MSDRDVCFSSCLALFILQNRLRPEIIRTLKAVKIVKVAAGGQHSLAISECRGSNSGGLLFTFGSNSVGQLGQQDYRVSSEDNITDGEGDRMFPTPKICDRLSEDYVAVDGACGKAHTLVVCRAKFSDQSCAQSGLKVFSMGLNSMGQCGLGHNQNVCRPTKISFFSPNSNSVSQQQEFDNQNCNHIHVYSGPLANHSFVSLSQSPLPRRLSLPSVDITALADAVNAYASRKDTSSLTYLREIIADSYSSLAVLNASFKYSEASMSVEGKLTDDAPSSLGSMSGGVVGAAIGLDMFAVRHAYSLIMSTGSDQVGYGMDIDVLFQENRCSSLMSSCMISSELQVISTLGRATLVVSDKLKECTLIKVVF